MITQIFEQHLQIPLGFLYSCSIGRTFEYEYEYHFIEYEYEVCQDMWVMMRVYTMADILIVLVLSLKSLALSLTTHVLRSAALTVN